VRPLLQYVNKTVLGWLRRKFKRFKQHKTQAGRLLDKLAREKADLFVHWRLGVTSGFV
jgi:RNA-directed DNA polymerase